jgi:hypothetical protein
MILHYSRVDNTTLNLRSAQRDALKSAVTHHINKRRGKSAWSGCITCTDHMLRRYVRTEKCIIRRLKKKETTCLMRTALFWVITQRVVIISYRRFGTTYVQGSRFLTPEHESSSHLIRGRIVKSRTMLNLWPDVQPPLKMLLRNIKMAHALQDRGQLQTNRTYRRSPCSIGRVVTALLKQRPRREL